MSACTWWWWAVPFTFNIKSRVGMVLQKGQGQWLKGLKVANGIDEAKMNRWAQKQMCCTGWVVGCGDAGRRVRLKCICVCVRVWEAWLRCWQCPRMKGTNEWKSCFSLQCDQEQKATGFSRARRKEAIHSNDVKKQGWIKCGQLQGDYLLTPFIQQPPTRRSFPSRSLFLGGWWSL